MAHLFKGSLYAVVKIFFLKMFARELHELNISLFKPKKDQCDLCCSFTSGNLDAVEYES